MSLVANNPALKSLIFYASLLGFKMLAMSLLTARQRLKKKVFANPEDTKMGGKVRVDDDVERVRRAHLNDLENIPIFLIAAGFYTLTNPSLAVANMLFRTFTIARFIHTFVYAVYVVPQPARGISWFVGYGITGYIIFQNLLYCL